MVEVHWTAYITAFTVPVLAAVGAGIAYRQWRTAQNKLKFDLFEKRMLVYQAARDTLGFIATRGRIDREHELKYLTGIQSSKWLFGQDVHKYLHETLWEKIVDLDLHSKLASRDNGDADQRSKHIQLESDTFRWLSDQYSVLDQLCAKYMTLGH